MTLKNCHHCIIRNKETKPLAIKDNMGKWIFFPVVGYKLVPFVKVEWARKTIIHSRQTLHLIESFCKLSSSSTSKYSLGQIEVMKYPFFSVVINKTSFSSYAYNSKLSELAWN